MKFVDRSWGEFYDRRENQPELESIDVLMMTLDEETFIERCLHSIYREIPIRRLIVCDGRSKDNTIKILKKFPRVELHIRPDIRTTAKILEFLFSQIETDWFAFMDGHLELEAGWYEKMIKHKAESDVLENSKRILGYHFFVEDKAKLQKDARFGSLCHLIKKEAVKNYKCDDDYMWRNTDIFFRYFIDKSGYKWKKISETYHVHNETERVPYSSDDDKKYRKYVFSGLKAETIDESKKKMWDIKTAKSMIKYLDPFLPSLSTNSVNVFITNLEREWIEKNGPKWLERYDKAKKSLELKKIELEKKRYKIELLSLLKNSDPNLPILKGKKVDEEIVKLSRSWFEKNAPSWLERFDKAKSVSVKKKK